MGAIAAEGVGACGESEAATIRPTVPEIARSKATAMVVMAMDVKMTTAA